MPQTETKIIHDKAFQTILTAVNKMVDFIRPTLGPASNKVIIEKLPYRMVVDDGVQIARDFELSDPAENAVVKIIRETAVKTNDRVGDGTTGSLILLQAIINEVSRKGKFNGHKIEAELKKALQEAKSQLLKMAKEIKTKEDMKKVALVSFDNEKIADIIADLYSKVGKDGVVTIDKSQTLETHAETTEGVKIERGYISPYMINNPQRMESILEKPYILITDYRLTEANDVLPIMNKLAAEGKNKLVIMAENIEQQALATLVINQPHVLNPQTGNPGVLATVAINLPAVEDRKVFLEDMALLTGAKMFTESKGDKLENAEISDLGQCERFICKREESIIIKPKGKKADIDFAMAQLRGAYESETDEKIKKDLLYRLGRFTNSIAVIKVGAPTDNEQKALKYKVEDVVNSVKSALKGGVVRGAGLALRDLNTSSSILNEAFKSPTRQLLQNMGMDENDPSWESTKQKDIAFNVVTKEVGEFLQVGVVDPVDALIAGIESAVSIASILLTSSGILVEYTKTDDN